MGREVKRVPLDFDWPIGQIWVGYKLSLCQAADENCDICHRYAIIKQLGKTEYSTLECPKLDNEPPDGDGYQLWETTTEGSPMSPVFATAEELAQWLTDNKASAFADMTLGYDTWLKFINGNGYAPSAVAINGVLVSGVEGIVERTK